MFVLPSVTDGKYLSVKFETETKMMVEVANAIARTGFTLIGLVKLLVLAYNRNLLADTLREMRISWKKHVQPNRTHRDFYEKSLGSVVKLTTYATIIDLVMVSFFNFLPILDMAVDALQSGHWARKMAFKVWYPFDPLSGWWYYLIYTSEVLAAFFVAVTNSGFNSMFCFLAVHLSTQIRVLSRSLEAMIRSEKDTVGTPRLILADTSSGSEVLKFFLIFVSILLEIFLLCYYGDEIMQSQSRAIGLAAYGSLWYEVAAGGDATFRKSLIPIIVRSEHPVVLMAWMFWPITISTVGMVGIKDFKNIVVILFALRN
ncbi:odorant receptor 4-like [Toxorhynchites rutilus septentrionalis]|uniref:odorant receptor 4-like n=1 Tax=Toxorhynchites rutilus septentrionalis TaxID=329112 RepID=UPI00247A2F9A|nr:odorant receptor 4-like [Toxorhynchites rutilus septentrionalis]